MLRPRRYYKQTPHGDCRPLDLSSDNIMKRALPTIGLLLSLPFMTPAWSKDQDASSCLNTLQSFFLRARLLPSGSRPPPPDMEVKALLGLQKSAIRTALGPPDKHEPNYPPLECRASQCWSFTYGPGPSPVPDPTDNGDGTMSVYVTTGGPWLLILGFTRGRLVNAFWRGQK